MPDTATALSILNGALAPPPPGAPSALPPPQFPATGGPPVPVDNTPAQQPDDFGSKLAILQAGSLGKLPLPPAQSPDSTWGGMAANFGAGGMQALTGLAGAPIDATTWLRRQAATAFGTWTPQEVIARGEDPSLFDGTTQVG